MPDALSRQAWKREIETCKKRRDKLLRRLKRDW
jgi:hypothetical protein